MTDRVKLLGRRADIAELTAGFDLAVSSSSWGEGFSNAVAEAMACGVPCVVTDTGDSAVIVGATGIVVPAGDADAMCAGVLEFQRLGAERRREIGGKGRERIVAHYEEGAVNAQYAKLYRRLIG
jgi:glycosyltransferase involved in cell wall biosynthesis